MTDLPALISRLEKLGLAKRYGDFYVVTTGGQVYSSAKGCWLQITGKITPGGYTHLQMTIDGRRKDIRLNRLVAECFHGPPPFEGAEARHLDGNPLNNSADNIAWGSASDNAKDAVRHGTSAAASNSRRSAHKRRGEQAKQAKLTWPKVRAIRARRARGETYASIAADYGVDFTNICHICAGRTWKD